jgi:hypothetical protein
MKPNVILSKTTACVTAGESRVSTSSTTAGSSTTSSVDPPQAVINIVRESRIINVFFTLSSASLYSHNTYLLFNVFEIDKIN